MLVFDAKLKTTPLLCLSFDLERVGCQDTCFCALKYKKNTKNQIAQELNSF